MQRFWRWIYLTIVIVGTILVNGLIFGWAPLLAVLRDTGVFSGSCENGEKNCAAANINLTTAFTCGSTCTQLSGIVFGPLMDRFGSRIARFLASVVFTAGCLCLGFASLDSPLWYIGFGAIALGGGGIQCCSFHVSSLFPGYEATVVSIISGMYAISSYVFLGFKLAYFSLGWSIFSMFKYYSIVGAASACASLLFPDRQFHSLADLDDDNRRDRNSEIIDKIRSNSANIHTGPVVESSEKLKILRQQNSRKGADEYGNIEGSNNGKSENEDTQTWLLQDDREILRIDDDDVFDVSNTTANEEVVVLECVPKRSAPLCIDRKEERLKQQVLSPEYLGLLSFYGFWMLGTSYFIASVTDQLLQQGDVDGVAAGRYAIISPLGFLAMPLAGVMQDRCSIAFSVFVVHLSNTLWQLMIVIPVLELQTATFILNTCAANAVFSVFFSQLAKQFGFKHFGFLVGISSLVAAGLNASISLLYSVSEKTLNHNYLPFNMVLVGIAVLLFAFPVMLRIRLTRWAKSQELMSQ